MSRSLSVHSPVIDSVAVEIRAFWADSASGCAAVFRSHDIARSADCVDRGFDIVGTDARACRVELWRKCGLPPACARAGARRTSSRNAGQASANSSYVRDYNLGNFRAEIFVEVGRLLFSSRFLTNRKKEPINPEAGASGLPMECFASISL